MGGAAVIATTVGAEETGKAIQGLADMVHDNVTQPLENVAVSAWDYVFGSSESESNTTTVPSDQGVPVDNTNVSENKKDTGLANLSDEEINRLAKDKSLSPAERQRYVTEQKARGQRNKQKRQNNNRSNKKGKKKSGSETKNKGKSSGNSQNANKSTDNSQNNNTKSGNNKDTKNSG